MEIGIKGTATLLVTEEYTAKAMGSGELPVFATPAMVALMEKTAWQSVALCLEPGQGTVGTAMEVKHLAATPVGMQVRCESELVEADDRRLVFRIAVWDACGRVGEATHERFVVNNSRFVAKAESKKG